MKKYTHAWIAFMAMKRIETANLPEEIKADAKALVKWFKNYRDFVIEGAWYPDEVYKDMATSHIIKYTPLPDDEVTVKFRKLPSNVAMYTSNNSAKKNPLFGKQFNIVGGNCADRCESIAHNIVDDFKMLKIEEKGNPICPTNNNIATRFFVLSHYIADCHMPLHCDSRSFSSGANIHGLIESEWDKQIKKSYSIDTDNERFFYDPSGYPLRTDKISQLMKDIEDEVTNREYNHSWGTGNSSTWDYMSSISQYSYLLAYKMLPLGTSEEITKDEFREMDAYKNLDEYTKMIFCDAIDSVAKIWLHVWIRYRKWATGRE